MTECRVEPQMFKEAFLLSMGRAKNAASDIGLGGSAKDAGSGAGPREKRLPVQRALRVLADELCFDYYRGYLGIGSAFVTRDEDDADAPGHRRAPIVAVAVEHEHAIRSSLSKMRKLAVWNAPLKVLITYPRGGTEKEYLRRYAEILGAYDLFKDFSFLRRHLVVFGTTAGAVNGAPVSWDFYHYLLGEFRPL